MTRALPRKPTLRGWALRAQRLAEVVARERWHPAVLAWAEAAPRGRPWGVACSGGADSLALLLLLWAHWPERRQQLRVLHFDHRQRGRESAGDAAFCRRVAVSLGVRVVVGRWGAAPAGAAEAVAREARLAFLRSQAQTLWFGHQQDDIAESMLMRLARGSGTDGLAAPRPVHAHRSGVVHLRPLLTLKKAEIERALAALGIPWRTDGSNVKSRHFRNRVRRHVVPAWRRAAGERDALAGAALARERLEEDETALAGLAEACGAQARDGALNLRRLSGQPRAVARRCLHRWLLEQREGAGLSRQAFESLLALVAHPRCTRQSLGRHGFVVCTATRMRFEAGPQEKL